MGQQQSEPISDRRGTHTDNDLHEQNAQLITELEQRLQSLHTEAQAREVVLKKRDDDIIELKETIRLQERKQEQLRHSIATYERLSFPQPDQAKAKLDKDLYDTQVKLSEKEKEIEVLRGEKDSIITQLSAQVEVSKRDSRDMETKTVLLIAEIAALKDQLSALHKESEMLNMEGEVLHRESEEDQPKYTYMDGGKIFEKETYNADQATRAVESGQDSKGEGVDYNHVRKGETVEFSADSIEASQHNVKTLMDPIQDNKEEFVEPVQNNTEDHIVEKDINNLAQSFGLESTDLSSLENSLNTVNTDFANELDLLSTFERALPPSSLDIFSKSATVEEAPQIPPLSPTKIQNTRNSSKLLLGREKPTRIKNGNLGSLFAASAPDAVDQSTGGVDHLEAHAQDIYNTNTEPSLLPAKRGKSVPAAHKSLFSLFPGESDPEPVREQPGATAAAGLAPSEIVSNAQDTADILLVGYSSKVDINKAGLKRAKKKSFGSSQPQMEDFHFCAYPFNDDAHKALFGVFDGHAGTEAASEACTVVPKEFTKQVQIAGDTTDATAILRKTIAASDQSMLDCEYVGATATLLYVWQVGNNRYLQAANLGDSAAFLCRGSTAVKLTVDHKASEPHEKQRMRDAGIEIGDNQSRINGLAVSRSLGNHFVKEQNIGMIAEPYVHECIKIEPTDLFVIIASDGLWDIVSGQRAVDIVLGSAAPCTSEEAASLLLRTAVQSSKCNDNVTVVVVQLNK